MDSTLQNAFASLPGLNGQAMTNLGGFSTSGAFFDTFSANGLLATGTHVHRACRSERRKLGHRRPGRTHHSR